MTNPGESQLVLYLILYVILPIWTVAGAVDWWCHRRTKIEENSGLRESLIHSIMGVQVGLPILACLMFEVNVLLMLFCFFILITHEYVAHQDIVYATPEAAHQPPRDPRPQLPLNRPVLPREPDRGAPL